MELPLSFLLCFLLSCFFQASCVSAQLVPFPTSTSSGPASPTAVLLARQDFAEDATAVSQIIALATSGPPQGEDFKSDNTIVRRTGSLLTESGAVWTWVSSILTTEEAVSEEPPEATTSNSEVTTPAFISATPTTFPDEEAGADIPATATSSAGDYYGDILSTSSFMPEADAGDSDLMPSSTPEVISPAPSPTSPATTPIEVTEAVDESLSDSPDTENGFTSTTTTDPLAWLQPEAPDGNEEISKDALVAQVHDTQTVYPGDDDPQHLTSTCTPRVDDPCVSSDDAWLSSGHQDGDDGDDDRLGRTLGLGLGLGVPASLARAYTAYRIGSWALWLMNRFTAVDQVGQIAQTVENLPGGAPPMEPPPVKPPPTEPPPTVPPPAGPPPAEPPLPVPPPIGPPPSKPPPTEPVPGSGPDVEGLPEVPTTPPGSPAEHGTIPEEREPRGESPPDIGDDSPDTPPEIAPREPISPPGPNLPSEPVPPPEAIPPPNTPNLPPQSRGSNDDGSGDGEGGGEGSDADSGNGGGDADSDNGDGDAESGNGDGNVSGPLQPSSERDVFLRPDSELYRLLILDPPLAEPEPSLERLAAEESAIQDARRWFETTSEWEKLRNYAEERFEEIHEHNRNLWREAEVLRANAISEIDHITSEYPVHHVTEAEMAHHNDLVADAIRGELPFKAERVKWKLDAQLNEWRKKMKDIWDQQSQIDEFQCEKDSNNGWVDEEHVPVDCSEPGALPRYKTIPGVCYRDFTSARWIRRMRRGWRILEGAGGPIVVGG